MDMVETKQRAAASYSLIKLRASGKRARRTGGFMETTALDPPQNADLLNPLLTTATCHQCRRKIKPGEYRVAVVAAELGPIPQKIDSSAIGGRRRFLAFCARCSFGMVERYDGEGEVVLRHPLVRVLFGSTRKQIAQDFVIDETLLREYAEEGKLEEAGRQAVEKELTAAAGREDSKTACQEAPTQTTFGDDWPRLIAEYLGSPKSFALTAFQRRVGEQFSVGKGQTKIALELHKSQPTVCRVIRDLKAIVSLEIADVARHEKLAREAQREQALVSGSREEALRKTVATGNVNKINEVLSGRPRSDDAIAHASTAGNSLERTAMDPGWVPARKAAPRGAGPDG
jgi:hypothetical protein